VVTQKVPALPMRNPRRKQITNRLSQRRS
jgi:hypothetical protein